MVGFFSRLLNYDKYSIPIKQMDTMKTIPSPELSLRERYFNKEIFNVGDLVESNQVEFKIISRGTNYLFLEDKYGNRTKKWIQDVTPMIEENYTLEDQIRVADIIAEALGLKQKLNDPASCIDAALKQSAVKYGQTDYINGIKKMLGTADKVGIKYNKKLVGLNPADVKNTESDFDTPDIDQKGTLPVVGASINPDRDNDQLRRMKIKYKLREESETCGGCGNKPCTCTIDNMSDKDIDKLIKPIDSLEDLTDAYDDEELHIVDHEGKHVSHIKEEVEINEVLSRMERIKAGIRFSQTASKRERKMQIALHTRSTPSRINHRARVMAVKLLKQKLMKKPLDQLTISEKEHLEALLKTRQPLLNRIALKLAPRIRSIENSRLNPIHSDKK